MSAHATPVPKPEAKPVLRVDVRREFTADRINKILNDPGVRPWVADADLGELDISKQVENRDNILLMGALGGCLLLYVMPGVFEVHSQCMPEGRGAWMKGFVTAALDWFFTHTNGWEITTRVPHGHLAAHALTKMFPFRHEFRREKECRFLGRLVDVDIYRMSIHDWAETSAWAEKRGEWFHGRLNEDAARLGVTAPPHEDDPQHNRIVGAALEMARNGQVIKSVLFYSRWAYMARHAIIEMVSEDPPAVKMDLGIIRFRGNDIEVSPC